MKKEIISDIRNKLQAPKTLFELLSKGQVTTRRFRALASRDLDDAENLLKQLVSDDNLLIKFNAQK